MTLKVAALSVVERESGFAGAARSRRQRCRAPQSGRSKRFRIVREVDSRHNVYAAGGGAA